MSTLRAGVRGCYYHYHLSCCPYSRQRFYSPPRIMYHCLISLPVAACGRWGALEAWDLPDALIAGGLRESETVTSDRPACHTRPQKSCELSPNPGLGCSRTPSADRKRKSMFCEGRSERRCPTINQLGIDGEHRIGPFVLGGS